jgi:hypothetical protein
MRVGLIVLCAFATIWGVAGVLLARLPKAWIAVPLCISAAVLIYAIRSPGARLRPGPHVGRLVGIWSGVEGAVMIVAANILVNTHHRDVLMPVFAIIVGLHFLPLARGIPVPTYYLTGTAQVAVGAIALLMPPNAPLFVGISAAGILWASVIALARGAP